MLDRALSAAEADDCYQALKLARRIIRHEDSVLSRSPELVGRVASVGAARQERQPGSVADPGADIGTLHGE
jgi:flagellar biosynthesis regulator FlbT